MTKETFIAIHNTSILPLRWFVNNIIHPFSMYFYKKADNIYYRDEYKIESLNPILKKKMEKYYNIYNILDRPYSKWGTVYKWEYSEADLFEYNPWHEDPVTGDAWRLVN
jgi:hypothetical protein